jgi:hypothetical protein
MPSRFRSLFAVVVLGLAVRSAAADPFRFPEGKHGRGELKYVNGLPILVVAGKPAEIGEQVGTLALKPAASVVRVFKDYLKEEKLDLLWPLIVRLGRQHFAKFPSEYRAEMEAMARCSGLDLDLLVVANGIDELRNLAGCSGLMVDPARSKSGAPLMGRNWDFLPLKGLAQYSLVTVYRPDGKRPFVTVGFPGLIYSGSLMNADGLALGANEVTRAGDGSRQVDPKGVPMAVVGRRLMEECATVGEAEKWLRAHRPSARVILVACDRAGGAVLEVTPKSVQVRRGDKGICVGTNHFCCPGLAVEKGDKRFAALSAAGTLPQLTVADLARKLHEANQGAWTLHTMVFEPQELRMHLALGDGKQSATTRQLQAIDLGPLFKQREALPAGRAVPAPNRHPDNGAVEQTSWNHPTR